MLGQLGLGAMNSLLGGHSYNNYGYGSQGLHQQGMGNAQYNSLLAQQQQAFNHAYNQSMSPPAKWMFDGKVCDVRTMADEIWKTDCPEKTHFILKYE